VTERPVGPSPPVYVTSVPVDPDKPVDPVPVEPPVEGGIVVVPGPGGESAPLVGAALTAGAGADAASTRSAAIAGAMLGILAAASGLAWALYKFKPGLIPVGPGAGAAGAGAPSAAAPLLASTPGNGPATASAPVADGTGLGGGGGADVGTMPAAGYSSSATGAGGGAYARGFGVMESSHTLQLTESSLAGGGAAAGLTYCTCQINLFFFFYCSLDSSYSRIQF